MSETYEFINQQFDFEREDQPDKIESYIPRIDYMWTRGKEMGISKEIELALSYLVTREDPTIELNSYFLPGKHDLRQVLALALERRPAPDPE